MPVYADTRINRQSLDIKSHVINTSGVTRTLRLASYGKRAKIVRAFVLMLPDVREEKHWCHALVHSVIVVSQCRLIVWNVVHEDFADCTVTSHSEARLT